VRPARQLGVEDFSKRFVSEVSGEWMYVFKPLVISTTIYVKLILRTNCVVVSFHQDEEHRDEEPE
jgi:hypothetical protein